jgi:uroporphyrinogen decarboxylase
MDKIERVDNVLSGNPVDRPPVTLWYHFGVQHGSGERFARLALDFFDHYDLDVLKVMNDYFYPMPEGLTGVRSREDLSRIEPFDVERSDWKEQLRALAIIARELKGRAYFVDTVFDPWYTMRRSLAGENLERLMEEEPEALQGALGVVAENLIAYCRRSLEAGAAGIFLAVPAGREIVSREHFLKFVKPFAFQVLRAVSGLAPMNTAHIHGDDLDFDDCHDLPAAILNWWDRGPGGPSLSSVKERSKGCVMGGIDHRILNRKTPAFIKEHVREGRRLGGGNRFILAGGCSIDSSVNPRAVQAVVEAAREPL